MKQIHIYRHVDCEGPGYLADFLEKNNFAYEIIGVDQGDPVVSDLSQVNGLVFMGGDMSANDPFPWVEQELALIRKAKQIGIPMLGHCLGAQLISKALGGQVTQNPVTEIGWFSVTKSPGLNINWLESVPDQFVPFHWHGETFSLPVGSTNILSNEHCKNQAFLLDNVMAFQCHIEMTVEMVNEWVHRFDYQLTNTSHSIQSFDDMLKKNSASIQAMQAVANIFYRQWGKWVRHYAGDLP